MDSISNENIVSKYFVLNPGIITDDKLVLTVFKECITIQTVDSQFSPVEIIPFDQIKQLTINEKNGSMFDLKYEKTDSQVKNKIVEVSYKNDKTAEMLTDFS